MELWQWGVTLILIWFAMGALVLLGYFAGVRVRLFSELDPDLERIKPDPLKIRYAITVDGRTPVHGELILRDLTRADWYKPLGQRSIREQLQRAYPGCEIIGYAAIDN